MCRKFAAIAFDVREDLYEIINLNTERWRRQSALYLFQKMKRKIRHFVASRLKVGSTMMIDLGVDI